MLREKEHVDLVVVAMHMGLEVDLRTGEKFPGQMPSENAALAIAENVPGIDVILMGHTHREVPSVYMTLNPKARIPKGPVTVRDIIGFYEYEATPIVVEVTGKQLKEALEHSARHFGAYKPNTPLSELADERFPSYTYDVAEGITYDLDISKPVGERIQNMRYRGQPVTQTQKLRLATITFRVNGGAGYTMFNDARVVYACAPRTRSQGTACHDNPALLSFILV